MTASLDLPGGRTSPPGIPARIGIVLAAVAGMFVFRSALRAAGVLDLPGAWLWGTAACTFPAVMPLWFLLPTPWPRLGFGKPWLVASAAVLVLFPFGVCAAICGLHRGDAGGWVPMAFVLLLVAASEELQFRCFLLDAFHMRGSGILPVLASSALFAAVHLDNPGSDAPGIANILLFGILLGMLRVLGTGLAGLSLVHWAWNLFTGMVAGWNVSGIELPSIWEPGADPFGAFGPESSPLLTVVLLAGTAGLTILVLSVSRAARGRQAAPEETT